MDADHSNLGPLADKGEARLDELMTSGRRRDPATPVARIGADELTPADPTAGMARGLAMHDAGMWTGVVDTEPGSVESNPGGEPARAVIVRCGTGDPTVYVDWPAYR